MDFQNLTKFKIFGDYFFVILSIHTPSLGHVRSQKLLQLNRFSRFDVYWIQTNQQTDKESIYNDFNIEGLINWVAKI